MRRAGATGGGKACLAGRPRRCLWLFCWGARPPAVLITPDQAGRRSPVRCSDGTAAVIGDKAGGLTVWELGGTAKPRKLQRTKLPAAVMCLAPSPLLAAAALAVAGAGAAAAATTSSSAAAAGAELEGAASACDAAGAASSGAAGVAQAAAVAAAAAEPQAGSSVASPTSTNAPADTPATSAGQQQWVAAGCADGSVHIVDVQRDTVLCTLRRHAAEVHSLCWVALPATPQASAMRLLVSASADRCMHVYAFPAAPPTPSQPPPPAERPQQAAADVASDAAADAAADAATSPPMSAVAIEAPAAEMPAADTAMGQESAAVCCVDVPEAQLGGAPAAPAELPPAAGGCRSAAGAEPPPCSEQHEGAVLGEPRFLCRLRLPAPPGGLSQSQKGRLWLAATWLPACCGTASGGGAPSSHAAAAQSGPCAWLVSSSYGGGCTVTFGLALASYSGWLGN